MVRNTESIENIVRIVTNWNRTCRAVQARGEPPIIYTLNEPRKAEDRVVFEYATYCAALSTVRLFEQNGWLYVSIVIHSAH